MSFFRLSNLKNEPKFNDDEEEEYLNVIAMIVTKIKRKTMPDGSFKFEFSIIQTETNGWTDVSYISKCPEDELKFCKLFEPIGSIIFINRCLPDRLSLELEFDDEMAAVVFRPNQYQVDQFMKVIKF